MMPRLSSLALLVLLVLAGTIGAAWAWQEQEQQETPAPAPAPAPTDAAYRAQVQTQLRLERSLLALDLASYREARDRETGARARVTEVAVRMDQALGGDAVALGNIEALHDELSGAREAAGTAAQRVEERLVRLQERLRRIGFLEGETGTRAPQRPDPVSGRWRIRILPQNATGTFNLRLSGTVVSGSYALDGISSGSLRGTFTGNTLRLERVDQQRGFDSVFVGTVGAGQISGTWLLNDLATGGPSRGDWTAIRENGP
jgi:hypothetical protein